MVKQKSSSVHTAHHAQRVNRAARFFLFYAFLNLEKSSQKIGKSKVRLVVGVKLTQGTGKGTCRWTN